MEFNCDDIVKNYIIVINKYYIINNNNVKFKCVSNYYNPLIIVNGITIMMFYVCLKQDILYLKIFWFDKEKFTKIYNNYPQYFLNINKNDLIKVLYKPVFVKKYLTESEDNDIEDYLT
jgi:hypothetical protein